MTSPNDDGQFMALAIAESKKSVSEDERIHPRVGVVVVKHGEILATAHRGELLPNLDTKGNHAEFIALQLKLPDHMLQGATVYTTLEPCTTRRHPKVPCAEWLCDRRVDRVVIGMLDPNPEICGQGQIRLRDAGIETSLFPEPYSGQAEEVNRVFLRSHRTKTSSITVASDKIDQSVMARRVFLPQPPLGRDSERDEAIGLLHDNRMLLLYGAPGQGKTLLARYIASSLQDSFKDGVFELSLQSEKQIDNLNKHLANALGEANSGNPFALLQSRRVLIVLDSFELILRSNAPDKTKRLLQSIIDVLAGGSRIIITSQDRFDLDGLVSKPVRRLQPEAATELFQRESADVYAAGDKGKITDFVYNTLGGHPLSIRIVARYSNAAKIDFDGLVHLWREKWTAIGQYRPTMLEDPLETSFELSYSGLGLEARQLFLTMSLLPDGIAGAEVHSIWGERDTAAVRALLVLEERSLLESEARRWRMLGPLFLFAQEKRKQAEVADPDLRLVLQQEASRIDSFYDEFVQVNAPQASDEDPREKNRRIREHFQNIHSSLDRRLEPSTKPSALAAADSVLRLYWAYHNNLSGYKNAISSSEDALKYLDKAADIFRIDEIMEKALSCRYYMGTILWLRGDAEKARPYLEQALSSPHTTSAVKYDCKRAFAHIEYKAGNILKATKLYEEVAAEAQGIGDADCWLKCQTGLIDAYRKLESFEKADDCYRLLCETLPSVPPSIRGNIQRGYAFVLLAKKDLLHSKELYEEALGLFSAVSPFGQAHCRRGLGDVFVELQNLTEAEENFKTAMTLYDEARKNPSLGVGLVELGRGRLAIAKQDSVKALEHFRRAADLFDQRQLNEPFELGQAYELMGTVLRRSYQLEDAVGHLELALRQYEQCGCEIPGARVRTVIRKLRAALE